MSASASSEGSPLEIGDKPHQLRNIQFPLRCFGAAKPTYHSFQAGWFDKLSWLHWNVGSESTFCHLCVKASRAGLFLTKSAETAFISSGFQSRKEAMRVMDRHETSLCHREAVEKLITIPATTTPVDEQLNS